MKKNVMLSIAAVLTLSLFSMIVIPNVMSASEEAPEIIGSYTATIGQSPSLSDDDLLDIAKITVYGADNVEVYRNSADFTKIGTHQVDFKATNKYGTTWFTTFVTVEDSLPTITNTKNSEKIAPGAFDTDFIELFNVVATEMTEGDLTSSISIDDSQVEYNYPGTYPVAFSVVDAEGNTANSEVEVTVADGSPEISGKTYATYEQGNDVMTDQELIDLFEIETNGSITAIDQYSVDYNTKGKYPVSFVSTNSHGMELHMATLEIV